MGAELFGNDLGVNLPNITSSGLGFWFLIGIAILLFLISIAVVVWWIMQSRIYNKKIKIFENIAGQGYQLIGSDTARIVKIGDGGEELLYLRKGKMYRTAYGRKMGKNTYWFAIGQDGYWYNILLGDLDAKMGMLDIEPIDRDMRYMHVAVRKNITERYRKLGVWEKYGTLITGSIFLLIMIIAIWLLLSKVGDLIETANVSLRAFEPTAEAMQKIASHIDSICSGGSGIKPAP